jgi:hypothetical protein
MEAYIARHGSIPHWVSSEREAGAGRRDAAFRRRLDEGLEIVRRYASLQQSQREELYESFLEYVRMFFNGEREGVLQSKRRQADRLRILDEYETTIVSLLDTFRSPPAEANEAP